MPKAVKRARFERRTFGEEGRVGGIGAGPAAFDVIDAQAVERQRDLALVLDREIHALGLRAVAQSGVENIEALFTHGMPSQWRTPPFAAFGHSSLEMVVA